MPAKRQHPPIWVMGLTNATFGIMAGFSVVTLPQILAAQGMPGGHIAEVTAIITSPSFWAFIFAPMLDVRLRRRTYALVFAVLTAIAAAITVLHRQNPRMIEIVMICGFTAATLYQGAVGGWMGSLICKDEDSRLGTWFNVANIGGGGVMIIAGGPIILNSPPALAAVFVCAVLLLPAVLFLFIPAPASDKVLASESFTRFWRAAVSLIGRREVLIGLTLFLLPSASFALSNVLGGIGKDYHASATTVSFLAGAGSVLAGAGGSFLIPQLSKKFSLRPLYLAIGIVGACFTFATLLLPRAPWTFGVVFTGEIVFQALAFTTANAITFEIIGQNNPLAATTFTLLVAAENLPVTYMGILDGLGYDHGGLVGSFAVDAGISMSVCIVLAIVLRRWLFAPRRTIEAA